MDIIQGMAAWKSLFLSHFKPPFADIVKINYTRLFVQLEI